MLTKKKLYILTILLILGIAFYTIKENSEQEQQLSTPLEKAVAIKIALLSDPAQDEDIKKLKGCDFVSYKDIVIPATTTPLNAAMIELFNPNKNLVKMEFAQRDFISTQKDLFFKNIYVKEGRAQVYLIGKVGPLAGVCDNTRIKTQIEETIYQFPEITGVDFYLNGIKTDFNFSEKGDQEFMNINVYVQNKDIARVRDCAATLVASYQIPKTTAVADASLKILFADELSKYGTYKNVVINNGIAKIMLENEIVSLSSCESSHLISVLTKTLTQYNTIKSIELYSPKGKIEF